MHWQHQTQTGREHGPRHKKHCYFFIVLIVLNRNIIFITTPNLTCNNVTTKKCMINLVDSMYNTYIFVVKLSGL